MGFASRDQLTGDATLKTKKDVSRANLTKRTTPKAGCSIGGSGRLTVPQKFPSGSSFAVFREIIPNWDRGSKVANAIA